MFTAEAQRVIDLGKDIAVTRGDARLTVQAIALALATTPRAVSMLCACLAIDAVELERHLPAIGDRQHCAGTLPLADDCRAMLGRAKALAEKLPLAAQPGRIALAHLVGAVAQSLPASQGLESVGEDSVLHLLAKWIEDESKPPSLGGLTQRLRALRRELLARVSGQDSAVHQFVEGLFSVEVVGTADVHRRQPAGLFVFAGPPGVGKTYLAELGASSLDRPFKRFDMSGYAHSHEATSLVGNARVYKDSQPGSLTDFVRCHRRAVLLFDEIEKAHSTAIHLFLQILDSGRLQDKHTEEQVDFRDTIVIFTTNVGRQLYDNDDAAGVYSAHAAFHRASVLDALRTECDPRTQTPFFPASICSRMATGHPILFSRLRVDDLARIAQAELTRVASLLERQHGQRYTFGPEVPLALVMREGALIDARTIKAQAAAFLKHEVFRSCQLFSDERVDQAFRTIETVTVQLDRDHAGEIAQRLFWEQRRPVVLFVGDVLLGRLLGSLLEEVQWWIASTADQAFDLLAKHDVDLVLLDPGWRDPGGGSGYTDLADAFRDVSPRPRDGTELHFDHAPLAARRYAAGQRLLRDLHSRMPQVPVYLFIADPGTERSSPDEELLLACVRAGGARGIIRSLLTGADAGSIAHSRRSLEMEIQAIAVKLRRESVAAELASNNQVLAFDTAPGLTQNDRCLQFRCRDFRLARSVRSADAGALVSDSERPVTRFDDVVGAVGAKGSLAFIRDWLKDPKKYAAAGVEPPRGVLLTGPPGTGKTMLARALAGESECAFLSEAATSFVTLYQGSGPESIRELFARARRYAPSVVFIDEIDAIGGSRAEVRAGHAGHGEALALNQLLVEMDGFGKPTTRPVIVIAATNRVETLDPALLRRFSRHIEVELPTRAERALYLNRRLAAKAHHEVSFAMVDRLAAQGQGMSVADYERILAQAAVMALENQGVIDDAILAEAFECVTMGEAKAGSDGLRTARHEAGHALIMCATGNPPIYVTIVGRGNFGGYAALEDKDERRSRTRPDLEDHICQLLGGREAERLYYGETQGASTGPANDLERATQLAEAMVYDYGMSPEIGFIKIDRRRPMPMDLAGRCHAAVHAIIAAQSERAHKLLSENRAALDRTAEALMQHSRLLQHEVVELLAPSTEQAARSQTP
jgi:ATP-dependent metalloprotease FtsH